MLNQNYIARCIEISKKGLSLAAPNPSVGAVLVFENKIIGEGFTSPFGGPHAEVNCINSVLSKDLKFIEHATLYVSLEPCSHYGKTAPCSILIIEKKIKKVVIGALDPNPKVAGRGLKMLQEKGIEVVSNILNEDCVDSNKRFFTFFQKKRPHVILKWAQTKNGFFAPDNNKQFWITNKYSKQFVHKWRVEEMAILIGKNTAKIDNPRLNARLFKGKNPIRIVIDKNLELDDQLILFNQEIETLIFNNKENKRERFIEKFKIDFSKVVIKQILDTLFKKGINSLIVEGGVVTLQSFIKLNLWDEARILTGENELETGLLAPTINGTLIMNKNLINDEINYYKNK